MATAADDPLLGAAEGDLFLLEYCRVERHLVPLLPGGSRARICEPAPNRHPSPSTGVFRTDVVRLMPLRRRAGGAAPSPHRRIERPAVEQQVLADDEAGRGGAQKGTSAAKFRGIAAPAGRVGLTALGEHLLEGDVLPPRLVLDA